MKRLCYLGILKEGFSAYLSPVMLIRRKVMQEKRVVRDFRHLNTRIAKNNLAYPLIKDTFAILGNSKCDVLLALDSKDAFYSQALSENQKKILWKFAIFCKCFILVPKNTNWTKCFLTNLTIIYKCNP